MLALAVVGTRLYVAGSFTALGDNPATPAGKIACWDTATSTWSTLASGGGNGFPNFAVYALANYGGLLYVGGSFVTVESGMVVNRLATWDGADWAAVPLGVGGIGTSFGSVFALAAFGTRLVMAGGLGGLGNGTTLANKVAFV